MLFLGKLATEEQIKQYAQFIRDKIFNNLGGCIDTAICESCKHFVTDSLCLCSGCFKCPGCGHENGNNMYVFPTGIIGKITEGTAILDSRAYVEFISEKPKKDFDKIP